MPIDKEAQKLFGFHFDGKTFTYCRLPQEFTNSLTIYADCLKNSMATCPALIAGQCLQYVDDLLVTGHTQQSCMENTLIVLRHLQQEGHKVSKDKIQFVQKEVVYLGHKINDKGKAILTDRKQVIQNAPKPQTKQQMMSFLGLCNFCRLWIPDYAAVVQPLQEIIYGLELNLRDSIT